MSNNEYTPTMEQIEDGYAHDREVAAKAKAAIIQRLRDTAQSYRPDSTHNAVADWLEREDFGVPVSPESEGKK